MKAIPGKRWDNAIKSWRVPASIDNLEKIKNIFPQATISAEALQSVEVPAVDINDNIEYKFKTVPYEHQRRGFSYFNTLDYGLVAWEMGTGKTKLAIDVFSDRIIRKKCRKVLVVAPNSILSNWYNEIKLHCPFNTEPVIVRGGRQHKIKLLAGQQAWTIINYDSVGTLETEVMQAGFDGIIADESHRIKNPQARRSKALHRIGVSVKYRLAMTGTPITQNPTDIFSQYKFINPAIYGPIFTSFKAKYLLMGGYGSYQVIGTKNLPDLNNKMYSCAMRVMKQDCLDLPDKVYEVRQVQMTAEQAQVYKQLCDYLIAEFRDTVITAPMIITKLLRLQQITGGYVSPAVDSTDIKFFKDNPKIAELLDIIEDIEQDKKIIIWARFLPEILQIREALDKAGHKYVVITGEVKEQTRQALIDDFNNNPGTRIFVGQGQTAGIGINLTAASYAVFYSNSYSYADRCQCEDRCHRVGSEVHKKITYIDLCAGGIDEVILRVLKKKGDLASEVMSNPLVLRGE
ncbi:MAG: DEAD/DEAH box helicase [Candidatus Omnitrophica bacterium]|nr:DEAD/DEAH box helicase [Candidatus Omnitrophota bacterium]